MSESEWIKAVCAHCGGDYPLECRHVAFVVPWWRATEARDERKDPGSSKAVGRGGDEP